MLPAQTGDDLDWACRALAVVASIRTGIRADALNQARLTQLAGDLAARGIRGTELHSRLLHGDAELLTKLDEAAINGETYFGRQPEHFEWLASAVVPQLLDAGRKQISALSAGCSTGEEAYMLTACLVAARDAAGSGVPVSVLATDLSVANIAVAATGRYGPRSQRAAPTVGLRLRPAVDGGCTVEPELQQTVSLSVANLLDPPVPPNTGPFDIVLCRNVLVYFTAQAREIVHEHLRACLASDGVILFGPADLPEKPANLVPLGPPELQAFRLDRQSLPLRPPSIRPPIVAVSARTEQAEQSRIARHVAALSLAERGERRRALQLLEELGRTDPEYVPALFERALMHEREGQTSAARALMRDVLRRTLAIGPHAVLAGPEPLPAGLYAELACSYFESRGGRT